MKQIHYTKNPFKQMGDVPDAISYFSEEALKKVMHFHASLPDYEPTPLHALKGLAGSLGVNTIYVKDESQRFGLNAFKGLGASYAMGAYFSKQLGLETPDFPVLSKKMDTLPRSTIATVTAGNHGKGVAWAAQLFGQDANVYLPKGSSPERMDAIRKLGANAEMSDLNYDDTVQHVSALAAERQWILMQDTAWAGYEIIPLYIMQGYATIIGEIAEQLQDEVTHVFLQAGVGSFAGSIAAAIYHFTAGNAPKMVVAEPEKAACLYQSALHSAGKPQRVHGDLATMMAGLACGEPNPIGWDILKYMSDSFFTCDDAVSAKGMQLSGHPAGNDAKIISGESGAVPLGLLHELMSSSNLAGIKDELELDDASTILVINTEGDTDPVNYKKIMKG